MRSPYSSAAGLGDVAIILAQIAREGRFPKLSRVQTPFYHQTIKYHQTRRPHVFLRRTKRSDPPSFSLISTKNAEVYKCPRIQS